MTAIEATSVRVSTLVDGTLRLVLDIAPTSAQDAFKLFGSPGRAVVVAALKDGHAKVPDAPAEKPRRGPVEKPIAQFLAMRCAEPAFQVWAHAKGAEDESEGAAAVWCRSVCGVASRGDIDKNAEAERKFRKHIQEPWRAYCLANGIQ